MPIYEFYCRSCHKIFNFFARSSSASGQPSCPKCGLKKLEKQLSRFAISKGLKEADSTPDPFGNLDDEKMESAMMELAGEVENVNEDDPQQMARMMKKLFQTTGMEPGDSIQEAIRRMEAGEDPDRIEEDLGDVLNAEDPFGMTSSAKRKGKNVSDAIRKYMQPPAVDPDLYDL